MKPNKRMAPPEPQNAWRRFLSFLSSFFFSPRKGDRRVTILSACLTVLLLLVVIAGVVKTCEIDLFSHSPYDQYTRQALAWRDGRFYLTEDRPGELRYLELAEYEGNLYVSFPPVPTLIELVMTVFFGSETPNRLYPFLWMVLSGLLLTLMARRRASAATSVLAGVLGTLGTSFVSICVFGGVWHEAQSLAFLLTAAAFFCMDSEKKELHVLGLFSGALAVGCRPFTVLFFPFYLWRLYLMQKGRPVKRAERMLPYLILPALVAVSMMILNGVRFGSPFEFGHTYLPEFQREANGQFSLAYLGPNLKEAFSTDEFFALDSRLGFRFNMYSGRAFYLLNPIYLLFLLLAVREFLTGDKKTRIFSGSVLLCLAVFVLLTCMHRTLGGFQFGARYFLDAVPLLAWALSRLQPKSRGFLFAVTAAGVAVNYAGALLLAVMM